MTGELYTLGGKLNGLLSVCNCCGAFGHTEDSIKTTNVKYYKDYINIMAGEFENISNEKYKVTTVQTKNGPVTVGYRHAW